MALEGSLQDMSLIDLFQIFRMGPKSGTLLLVGGPKRGVIYVFEGRLIDAAVVQGRDRQVMATGESAVLDLLEWEEATFIFRADADVARRPVRIVRDSEVLVMEWLRQHDQLPQQIQDQRIGLSTRLELAPAPGRAAEGLSLDLDQWRLLSQVALSYDVGELCQHTGMPADQVIRLVTELIAIGLITIIEAPRPIQPTPPPRPAVPLMDRAVGGGGRASTNTPVAERGLLSAIMRRIRSL